MEQNNLQKALMESYADEIKKLVTSFKEDIDANNPFSHNFDTRMTRMIHDSQYELQRKETPAFAKRHPRIRRIAIIAAIIAVVLATTVVTIGIIKPQILYDIQKVLLRWDIHYEKNTEDADPSRFDLVKPVTPDGYYIVDEVQGLGSYHVEYSNEPGSRIIYLQMNPENATTSISGEEGMEKIQINGRSAIVFNMDNYHMIVIEDGYYVYSLEGDCSYETLYFMAESLIRDE